LNIKQIPDLDGVRGIAILLVLLLHFSKLVNWYPLVKSAAVGWVGVNLFFVLSGFLITGILLDAKGSKRYFRNFYARRVLRIFPLYFGFLALVLMLSPWFVSAPSVNALRRETPWYLSYLFNWRAASAQVPLGHLWSLAVEEQFYLVWPFLVYVMSSRALKITCFGLIFGSCVFRVIAVAYGFPRFAYFATPACMEELAYGALGAVMVRESGSLWWRNRALGVGAIGFVAVFAAARGFEPNKPLVITAGVASLSLSFFAIVLLAYAGNWSWLRAMPLRWLGKYSYGLYILHFPIVLYCERWGGLAAASAGILASCGLAWISYTLYEQRFLKLKDRFLAFDTSPAVSVKARQNSLLSQASEGGADEPRWAEHDPALASGFPADDWLGKEIHESPQP